MPIIGDTGIKIPKVMLEEFQRDARIIIKLSPAGLWPIPPELFTKVDFLKNLMRDKEFAANFQVVVMPREM